MDNDSKKPRAREKRVTEGGGDVHKKGEGLGIGPVGSQDGYASRKKQQAEAEASHADTSAESGRAEPGPGGGHGSPRGGHGGGRGPGGDDRVSVAGFDLSDPKIKKLLIVGAILIPVIIVVLIFVLKSGAGGSLSSLLGGSTLPSGFSGEQSGGYTQAADVAADTSVASGSRAKRTTVQGGGKDKITIMVYMCGTDLESKHGMASSDLSEMAAADLGSNINIIVYTGGCNNWKTSGISTKVNQIYQVQKGGLNLLVDDDGSKSMVGPSTLSGFIKYCAENFPANRNELILWDHGGGSVSGYGYDEKYSRSGSMSLSCP